MQLSCCNKLPRRLKEQLGSHCQVAAPLKKDEEEEEEEIAPVSHCWHGLARRHESWCYSSRLQNGRRPLRATGLRWDVRLDRPMQRTVSTWGPGHSWSCPAMCGLHLGFGEGSGNLSCSAQTAAAMCQHQRYLTGPSTANDIHESQQKAKGCLCPSLREAKQNCIRGLFSSKFSQKWPVGVGRDRWMDTDINRLSGKVWSCSRGKSVLRAPGAAGHCSSLGKGSHLAPCPRQTWRSRNDSAAL